MRIRQVVVTRAGGTPAPPASGARRAAGRPSALALLVALGLALGCSGHSIVRQAQQAEIHKDWDQAVLHYLEAVRLHPENISYRAALMRAKIQASQEHVHTGKEFHEAGVPERALIEYRQAVELDPSNQYAEAELSKIVKELRHREEDGRQRSISEMK